MWPLIFIIVSYFQSHTAMVQNSQIASSFDHFRQLHTHEIISLDLPFYPIHQLKNLQYNDLVSIYVSKTNAPFWMIQVWEVTTAAPNKRQSFNQKFKGQNINQKPKLTANRLSKYCQEVTFSICGYEDQCDYNFVWKEKYDRSVSPVPDILVRVLVAHRNFHYEIRINNNPISKGQVENLYNIFDRFYLDKGIVKDQVYEFRFVLDSKEQKSGLQSLDLDIMGKNYSLIKGEVLAINYTRNSSLNHYFEFQRLEHNGSKNLDFLFGTGTIYVQIPKELFKGCSDSALMTSDLAFDVQQMLCLPQKIPTQDLQKASYLNIRTHNAPKFTLLETTFIAVRISYFQFDTLKGVFTDEVMRLEITRLPNINSRPYKKLSCQVHRAQCIFTVTLPAGQYSVEPIFWLTTTLPYPFLYERFQNNEIKERYYASIPPFFTDDKGLEMMLLTFQFISKGRDQVSGSLVEVNLSSKSNFFLWEYSLAIVQNKEDLNSKIQSESHGEGHKIVIDYDYTNQSNVRMFIEPQVANGNYLLYLSILPKQMVQKPVGEKTYNRQLVNNPLTISMRGAAFIPHPQIQEILPFNLNEESDQPQGDVDENKNQPDQNQENQTGDSYNNQIALSSVLLYLSFLIAAFVLIWMVFSGKFCKSKIVQFSKMMRFYKNQKNKQKSESHLNTFKNQSEFDLEQQQKQSEIRREGTQLTNSTKSPNIQIEICPRTSNPEAAFRMDELSI